MMLLSTLASAAALSAVVYFLFIRFVPWAAASYAFVLIIAYAFFYTGSVHLVLVGVFTLALGCLLVWCHHKWWRSGIQPRDP